MSAQAETKIDRNRMEKGICREGQIGEKTDFVEEDTSLSQPCVLDNGM